MIVATTERVVVEITETVPSASLTAHANLPFGVIATSTGFAPTVTGAPTDALVARSITETVPSPEFAT